MISDKLSRAYVLATKFSDGDPADAWCVGYYLRKRPCDRHAVGNADGGTGPHGFRFSGYAHIGRIDKELGNWLMANCAALEKAPAGTVNLWKLREARLEYLATVDEEQAAFLREAPEPMEDSAE